MSNDPFLDLVQVTVAALHAAEISYAITGSIASGIHGEPVVSQDIDFVVRMTQDQAKKLDNALPARFYRSTERLLAVASDGGLANLIDTETGLKVDLSVLSRDPFFDLVISRAKPEPFGEGRPSFVTVTPEDIILMKLTWRKDSRSEKQWRDAIGVAEVKGARMDWKYLFDQARALGVEDDLTKLRDDAGI